MIDLVTANLPPSIYGLTVSTAKNAYLIILNSCYSIEEQASACTHEIFHILNSDFEKLDSIQAIEAGAHLLCPKY